MPADGLIGRVEERARLDAAAQAAASGEGSLMLLSGEAGVGKTRLAEAALGDGELRVLRASASPSAAPYAPLTAAFRALLRAEPAGLDGCGPLRGRLAVLMPELAESAEPVDPDTLIEAIRCALIAIAADAPTVLLLDDLQWTDAATLELLAAVAPDLSATRMLVVAAYRSDEVARDHPVRRLRTELRREQLLHELALEPLTARETAELAEHLLGAPPSPRLAETIHGRSGGNPFFAEELTLALADTDRLVSGADGFELTLDADLPLPATVRDAVLVRNASLSDGARAAAEAAAVAGNRFDGAVLAELSAGAAIEELLAAGMLSEQDAGQTSFRHPLVRDAIYEDIPWLRRSTLHRRLAELLDAGESDNAEIAAHWLAARETGKALDSLIAAIADRGRIGAHRDAADLGRQALELWPEGERAEERAAVLEQHARHAELAGDLAEAARAQREVVAARRIAGAGRALADAERRIAGIYALQGDRPRALAARRVAAESYAANGLPGEAAAERLVIAGYLQSAGEHTEAAQAAASAREEALHADRIGLRARAMGLEGVARVKGGSFDEGIAIVLEGLSLALEHELTAETAEVYQRLGTAREIAGDYLGAADALGTAIGICEAGAGAELESVCLSCMAYVLRELGEWNEVDELCVRLIAPGASPGDTLVADGVLGAIEAWRGRPRTALELLTRCHETASSLDVVSMQCDSAAALAWLFAEQGDSERALEHCRLLLDRWERSEDHHYAVWGLRWASGWLAQNGHLPVARECANALSAIVGSAGHPDALAALAYALGETALADGDLEVAAEQFSRACDLHEQLHIPFERANVLFRAGVVLRAAGELESAADRLVAAYRGAQELGAGPLASLAASEIAAMGESLEQRLGVRAADELQRAGLSRREHEVVRLVAAGMTNKQIAARLVLSTRTVDAHLRSILTKLDCRTRTEAAARAGEIGLLDDAALPTQ